jgi:hypothetical protein
VSAFLPASLTASGRKFCSKSCPEYAGWRRWHINTTSPQQLEALHDAARGRGIELAIYRVSKAREIPDAIDAAKNSGAAGINVLASTLLFNNRQIILPRVSALSLPAIYQFPTVAEEGGLIGYGVRLEQIFRDIAIAEPHHRNTASRAPIVIRALVYSHRLR